MGPGAGEGTSALKRHSIASGQIDFADNGDTDSDALQQSAGSPVRPAGRMRSLSAAVGDIFGSQKRRRVGSRGDADEQGNNDAVP